MKRSLNGTSMVVVALVVVAIVSIAPSRVSAQSVPSASWTQISAPGPAARSGVSLTFDSARGHTVMFGGSGAGPGPYLDETWEFDGTSWNQRLVSGPLGRYLAPMVYDSARKVSVLFGGYGAPGYLSDTWEWDGSTWTQRFTAHAPPPRDWAAMTYDSRRHVVVLFGGLGGTALLNDTWEYDGNDWTQVITAHSPSARRGMALAFDVTRGKTVLFGGQADVNLNDTWEYDGVDWTQVSLAAAPQVRLWHSMAFDAALGGVVMFGGAADINTPFGDTWLYDGMSWQQITSTNGPSDRFWAPVVYDSAHSQLLVFGGSPNGATLLGDFWALGGTNTLPLNWAQASPATSPPARTFAASAYDSRRDRVVLFGGGAPTGADLGDTWEWDGFNWTNPTPSTAPPAVAGASMAYDSARGVSVLFGGSTPSGLSSDTWEWDGSSWTHRTPAMSPPPMVWTGMVYDSTRSRIVLFGSFSQFGVAIPETWEYDGTIWTQAHPTNTPSPRTGPNMAFDSVRNRVVLFGGRDANGQRQSDTWDWDGTNWTQIAAASAPYARFWSGMAFDPVRGKSVLFGGDHVQPFSLGPTNDTWEFDGTNWTRDWTAAAPSVRAGQTMVYDSALDRLVMFGGFNAAVTPNTYSNETWELGTGITTPPGSPIATLSSTALDFGSVDVGATSAAALVVLTSSGTGPLVTTSSITGDFAISSTDCPSAPDPLAAGSTCFMFITFSPTVAGDRTGALTLTGNVAGGSQAIPLHGIGNLRDFAISASPTTINMTVGGPNPTVTVSTTAIGDPGTINLSALTTDPGVTATFSPASLTAGSSSTLTIVIAPSVVPGVYGVAVVGDEGTTEHRAPVVTVNISPIPDFSIAVSASSPSIVQGSTDIAIVTTALIGAGGPVNLSASASPAGLATSFSSTTVAAGDSSTLFLTAGYGLAPGTYTVTVTGVEGSKTHSANLVVTVTQKGLVNGDFETGDLTGWSSSGVTGVSTSAHTGRYSGQVGSVSASGSSTLAQIFTVPSTGGKLTFWYWNICSDKVKNDWFTATLVDGVTGSTTVVQTPVCTKSGSWTKVTVNLGSHGDHYVTLTLINQDDGNPADPSYTLVDDVALS